LWVEIDKTCQFCKWLITKDGTAEHSYDDTPYSHHYCIGQNVGSHEFEFVCDCWTCNKVQYDEEVGYDRGTNTIAHYYTEDSEEAEENDWVCYSCRNGRHPTLE